MLNRRRRLLDVLVLSCGVAIGVGASVAVLWHRTGQTGVNAAKRWMGLAAGPGEQSHRYAYGAGSHDTSATSYPWNGVRSLNSDEWMVRRGLDVELVATGFTYPVNLAFRDPPDASADAPLFYVGELHGRILAVARDGKATVFADGLTRFEPVPQDKSDETGLSGLTTLPGTEDLLVTTSYLDPRSGLLSNRILRVVSRPGGRRAERVDVLLDLEEFTSPSNQIQQVAMGPDGKIYVSVGDAENPASSIDPERFGGKILRLNLDGSAPSDNPFYDAAAPPAPRSYVYVRGLRNVFDFDFEPTTGDLYAADNGTDLDRFLRAPRGASFAWNGDPSTIRCNALYTWGPSNNTAPVGLTFLRQDSLGSGTRGLCYVGQYGRPALRGPGDGKSIWEFAVDPALGLLARAPEIVLQNVGPTKATVLGVAEGPDGLYFTDFFGASEGADSAGQGRVWKLAPSAATRTLPSSSGASPAARLFLESCSPCHRVAGVGGHEGPELTNAAANLKARLSAKGYTAMLESLLESTETYRVEQKPLIREVLAANAEERPRVWLHHHLREPRFDNVYAKMPSFAGKLSDAQLDDLVAYVLTLD